MAIIVRNTNYSGEVLEQLLIEVFLRDDSFSQFVFLPCFKIPLKKSTCQAGIHKATASCCLR